MGINENGELCIKLPLLFSGYLENLENSPNYFDSDGFLFTGDIAYFDDNGDLFIVDRKKDLFKSYGDHVIPSEIEEILNKIDGVKQSCLIPIPDPKDDNLPAAVIVKTENSQCTEEIIFDSVKSKLNYMVHLNKSDLSCSHIKICGFFLNNLFRYVRCTQTTTRWSLLC